MKKAIVTQIFERLHAENPNPKGELVAPNTYTLLVSVILSAQATDTGVNKATKSLYQIVKTPEAMLELGLDALMNHVKSINYYRAKSRNIIAMSQKLLTDFGGEVPQTREALMSLAGVGRKTANVVLNLAFGHPTVPVDTHAFRVANRTGLAKGTTPDEVERKLEKAIPLTYRRDAHNWLVLHGRYVCKARKPACEACIISDLCPFPKHHLHIE